jgi:hypothetical protein
MPLHVGWHLAIRVLPIGTTRERRVKPLGSDLHQGASSPIWSYGEALAHTDSHPPMMTRAPLKSLLGTAVPCLRPLANSGTWEPHQLGKYPVSSAPVDCRNT